MTIDIWEDSPPIEVSLKLTESGKKEVERTVSELRARALKLESCPHDIILKGTGVRAVCTSCRYEWQI